MVTENEIKGFKEKIFYFLSKSKLGRAFELLDKLLLLSQEAVFADKIDGLKTTYKLMLQYSFQGINDPEQQVVYQRLLKETYEITDAVTESWLKLNSFSYYYSSTRLFLTRDIDNSFVMQELEKNDLEKVFPTEDDEKEYEFYLSHLFTKFWLTSQYNDDSVIFCKSLVENVRIKPVELSLAASAIMLSTLHLFDEKKFLCLFELQKSSYKEVSLRALTGIVLSLFFHNDRIVFYPTIRNKVILLFEAEKCVKEAQLIIQQLVRSKETERITKDITENIMPQISKIAPRMRDDLVDIDQNEDFEEKKNNWQDLIDETGVGDKMQQYAELQEQGSDIQMSTFSMLKNYPFFTEVGNWFLPFFIQHSSVKALFLKDADGTQDFVSSLVKSNFLCHSDKYSFCLNLVMVPENYRKAMMNGLQVETDQMKELEKDKKVLSQDSIAEVIINKYIQDLYRFFKLFVVSHKDSFEDIFSFRFDFHKAWFFRFLNQNNDFLVKMGEFFFAKNLFENALSSFLYLDEQSQPDVERYRKIGFCYQKLLNFTFAIDYYKKAELIETDNLWTIRKIAYCYRNLKQYDEALDYYLVADSLAKDNQSILFNIGICYFEQKQFDKALNYFFKIEFISNNNKKAENYIALCSFFTENYATAETYYLKQPEDNGYYELLYLAHCYWCMKNKSKALEYYKKSAGLVRKEQKGNCKLIYETLEEEADTLAKYGISALDISFISDAVRYDL